MLQLPFFETYPQSLAWFKTIGPTWANRWHATEETRLMVDPQENLTIEALWLHPARREKLVVLSVGEHGIEGYVGSTMARLFCEQFLGQLNPENTGVVFVHAINPWGMSHYRRVNKNGVDLNRNFILNGSFNNNYNQGFSSLSSLLVPGKPIGNFELHYASLFFKIANSILKHGMATLTRVTLLGQYQQPRSIFFGGQSLQPESEFVVASIKKAMAEYQHILILDQHTGYGPRYQMGVVVPPTEPLSSAQLEEKFGYPYVVKGNQEEFYQINGDMVQAISDLGQGHPGAKIDFACSFEFGTYGDGLLARAKSLAAMILESQNYSYPAISQRTEQKVRQIFKELYFPSEPAWRQKALQDGYAAFKGILSAYQYI